MQKHLRSNIRIKLIEVFKRSKNIVKVVKKPLFRQIIPQEHEDEKKDEHNDKDKDKHEDGHKDEYKYERKDEHEKDHKDKHKHELETIKINIDNK